MAIIAFIVFIIKEEFGKRSKEREREREREFSANIINKKLS